MGWISLWSSDHHSDCRVSRSTVWSDTLVKHLTRTAGAIVGLVTALVIIVTLAIIAGPQIEGSLFPIIEATHVAKSVMWTPEILQWSVHYKKFRNDVPAYFNYRVHFVSDSGEERAPLAACRVKEDGTCVYLSTFGFANHNANTEWTAIYRAELPRGVNIRRPFMVEGEGFYDAWHHFWLVPQKLPSFEVPAEDSR